MSRLDAADYPGQPGIGTLCGCVLNASRRFLQLRALGGAQWWKGFDTPSLQALVTIVYSTPASCYAEAALAAGRTSGGLAAVDKAYLASKLILLQHAGLVLQLVEGVIIQGVQEGCLDIGPAMHCSSAATQVGASAALAWLRSIV